MKLKIMIGMLTVFWIGMIFAIGMESIVKFNTPTLTKAVGFDVGRTVFSAFNKAQALLLVLLLVGVMVARMPLLDKAAVLVIAVILLLQIGWLFPLLSQRVDMILTGVKPPPSYQHAVYGMMELTKLVLLGFLAVRVLFFSL